MSRYFSQRFLPGALIPRMVFNEIPSGAIDGVNAVFSLAFATESPGSLALFKNGIAQLPGAGNDYTVSGQTITFEPGNLPQAGDNLLATYQRS